MTPIEGCNNGPMEIAAAHPQIYDQLERIRARRTAETLIARVLQNPPRERTPRETEPLATEAPSPKPVAETEEKTPPKQPARPEKPELAAVTPKPPAPPPDRQETDTDLPAERFLRYLRTAIDKDDAQATGHLLDNWPRALAKPKATVAVSDRWGTGQRLISDHSLLTGHFDRAEQLASAGIPPSNRLVHLAIENAAQQGFQKILDFALRHKADSDGLQNDRTPLMLAADLGDTGIVEKLLKHGADPGRKNSRGQDALDVADASGNTAILERLVLHQQAEAYRDLMMGLSWADRFDTLQDHIDTCKTINDGYLSCKLKKPAWLSDAAAIVAQFDTARDHRLVALQIDSQLLDSAEQAQKRFDEVVAAIRDRLPDEHESFANREAPTGPGFFSSLQRGGTGGYFNYWPDNNRRRPVFVMLSIKGYDARRGYYRLLIGNPFALG